MYTIEEILEDKVKVETEYQIFIYINKKLFNWNIQVGDIFDVQDHKYYFNEEETIKQKSNIYNKFNKLKKA